MRNPFSHYPSGRPGWSLLVLRLALALRLADDGRYRMAQAVEAGATEHLAVAIALLACSVLVAVGLYTPLVETAVAGLELAVLGCRVWTLGAFALSAALWNGPFLDMAIAISLALIGPGAYSIDSRRFGRREIVIPPLAAHAGSASHIGAARKW